MYLSELSCMIWCHYKTNQKNNQQCFKTEKNVWWKFRCLWSGIQECFYRHFWGVKYSCALSSLTHTSWAAVHELIHWLRLWGKQTSLQKRREWFVQLQAEVGLWSLSATFWLVVLNSCMRLLVKWKRILPFFSSLFHWQILDGKVFQGESLQILAFCWTSLCSEVALQL